MTPELTPAGYAPLQAALNAPAAQTPDGIPAIVDLLIQTARRQGSSDLHLEPRDGALFIRLRMDGCLHTVANYAGPCSVNLIQRFKVLAGLLTYRTDIVQEGRMQEGEARISILPTVHGEKAVVRFFLRDSSGPDALDGVPKTGDSASPGLRQLDGLGLAEIEATHLKQLLARPNGLLLLAGPAGSGKTTTLYACLEFIARLGPGERQIVTLEDPVERVLEVATQVPVSARLEYPAALRAVLRQDPEVLMVGEVRDRETAAISVEAALTGHLILTTVHAASAPEALIRLADLGVERALTAQVVSGILAQRLARRLCTECRIPNSTAAEAVANVAEPFTSKPGGCEICRGTGFKNRRLLAELLAPLEPLRTAYARGVGTRELAALAAAQGCAGLWARGMALIEQGETTLAEMRRILAAPDE